MHYPTPLCDMDANDFIIYGRNAFKVKTKEAELLKVGHPGARAKVSVKVVFHSGVRHFAFEHSPSGGICGVTECVGTDEKITVSNFDKNINWPSLKENFSKSIPAANPKIRPGTQMFEKILDDVSLEINRSCILKVDYIGCTLLLLEVLMEELVLDCCECGECRAIRESVESLIVPASESSIKKLLKRVRVAAAADLEEDRRRKRRRRNNSGSKSLGARPSDGDDCTICSDEFTAGKYAAQMPCLHSFHRSCIEAWLRQSHYCPICRYEMPVADDQEDG